MKLFLLSVIFLTINISSSFAQQNSRLSNKTPLVSSFALSQPLSVQKKQMNVVAEILKEDETTVGYVIISISKEYKNKEAFYKERIKNYLFKAKGINLDRLKIYSDKFSKIARVDFYIIPKEPST